jgi:hypothetical protein
MCILESGKIKNLMELEKYILIMVNFLKVKFKMVMHKESVDMYIVQATIFKVM